MEEEVITVESVEDQAEAIIQQIEEAEKAKEEKLGILYEMVDNRVKRMQEVWGGALGYEQAAEKLRLFMGTEGELNFHQVTVVRNNVVKVVENMAKAYKDERDKDTDWVDWLDQWCKVGGLKSYAEVAKELLVLDVCQHVWEALRRIPEFTEAVDREIGEMRSQLNELY